MYTKVYEFFGRNLLYIDVLGGNAVATGVFWIWCALFAVVDLTGKPEWFKRYKTQPGKNEPLEPGKMWRAVRVALFNQMFVGLPMSLIVALIRSRLLDSSYHLPEMFPSLLIIIRDLAVFLVIEEVGFYYTHRLVHWGPLYKSVHKMHHEWTAPIGVVAIYAHPFEHMLSNVFPFVLGPLIMNSHIVTAWIWYTLAASTTVIHHSGYHLPLLPSPEFHDFHHLKFTSNFGVAGWMDWLHGTDEAFRSSVQQKRDHFLRGLTPANQLYKDTDTHHEVNGKTLSQTNGTLLHEHDKKQE